MERRGYGFEADAGSSFVDCLLPHFNCAPPPNKKCQALMALVVHGVRASESTLLSPAIRLNPEQFSTCDGLMVMVRMMPQDAVRADVVE